MALFQELEFAKTFDKSDLAYCVIKIILNEEEKPCDWEFVYLNDALARIEGVEKEKLLNHRFFEVFPDADTKWFDYYYPAAYENRSFVFEEMSEEIGTVLRIRCFPVEYGYCACLLEDVTNEFESVTAEGRELREVRDLMQAAKWNLVFDEKEQIRGAWFSDEFRHILGFANEDDFPNDMSACMSRIHPEDYKGYIDSLNCTIKDCSDQTPFNFRHRMKKKNGEYIWVRSDAKIHRDKYGKAKDMIGVFVDINDTYLKEEKQKELEQTQYALQETIKAVEQANRAKTAFLSNMSHDIRTPMNAIVGFTDLAQQHLDNPELLTDYLAKIKVASKHLLGLINDVLDMSRIESGTVLIDEKEENLVGLLEELIELIHSNVKKKQLEFQVDISSIMNHNIICDKLRLNQVLLNILSNAIKYTPKYGVISFSASEKQCEEDGYATYEFRIKDTGIGMSKDFQKIMFQAFTRERNTTENGIEGTGLGMAITKSLVDNMGGTIACFSKEGEGTEFVVVFDFKKSEIAPQSRFVKQICKKEKVCGQKARVDYHDKKVLVVEDNELNREIAEEILKSEGLQVLSVSNGKEACELLEKDGISGVDLILMDIQMPVMDGYETTKWIREHRDLVISNIPIVAMTANAFEEDKKRVARAGMNKHIAKPIDRKELMSILENIL